MALALSPPRVPKPKSALPSHYYESFLEKKGPRDRVRRVGELALLDGPWAGAAPL